MSKIYFILVLILFIHVDIGIPQDSIPVVDEDIEKLQERIDILKEEVSILEVSQLYFNSILNSQTAIFSLILVIIIGFNFFLSKQRIESIVSKEILTQERSINSWKDLTLKEINERLSKRDKEIDLNLVWLDAANNRALALANEDTPSVAFVWWMRTAKLYNSVDSEDLVNISLENALKHLKRIDTNKKFPIPTAFNEEYFKLIKLFESEKFSELLENIDVEIKKMLPQDEVDTDSNT